MKTIAKILSRSVFFSKARKLLELNLQDWNYPLSKWGKLLVGSYMILRDYGNGTFPQEFKDEQSTFSGEKEYYNTLQKRGKTPSSLYLSAMQKPFWHGRACAKHLQDYIGIQSALYEQNIHPPSKLLEVGCGSGWVAEFLTSTGFNVLASTLDANSEKMIKERRNSLAAKNLPDNLQFRAAPMEYIHEAVSDCTPFDAAYVYEALHHAHDWRKSLDSLYQCLRPGGLLLILNEPNLIHTFVSYRVGQLSGTHEVGINPTSLKKHLKSIGFSEVRVLKNRMHYYARPTWIAALKNK